VCSVAAYNAVDFEDPNPIPTMVPTQQVRKTSQTRLDKAGLNLARRKDAGTGCECLWCRIISSLSSDSFRTYAPADFEPHLAQHMREHFLQRGIRADPSLCIEYLVMVFTTAAESGMDCLQRITGDVVFMSCANNWDQGTARLERLRSRAIHLAKRPVP